MMSWAPQRRFAPGPANSLGDPGHILYNPYAPFYSDARHPKILLEVFSESHDHKRTRREGQLPSFRSNEASYKRVWQSVSLIFRYLAIIKNSLKFRCLTLNYNYFDSFLYTVICRSRLLFIHCLIRCIISSDKQL